MKKMIVICAFVVSSLINIGCNSCARKYGGRTTQELPCDRKLVDITWKDSDLWILTRARQSDELIETYKFSEEANFAFVEGEVVIIESVCKNSK